MMLFFLCLAGLCAYLSVRLRDRWLRANAVLFMGLAGMPYCAGVSLWGWWLVIGLTAWGAARWGVRQACPAPAPPTPRAHYAVCRPYHSSATSEDRA
ncbi:MAG: hypothetical protein KatS3mg020_0958 [Fimbriimonadales bacterium]|nr:MAG: hypothetical protein KatS3mg020_0958 [Fimbriimonadales bacterium]